jgi:spore maturation protein CgeB
MRRVLRSRVMEIHLPRLNVSPRLREMMAYPKFRGVPRVLVLENEYWLDSACVRAASALGWAVQSVPVRMEGAMPRDLVAGFLSALTEFRPDFVLSINLSGMDTQGLFAGLFCDLAMPYAAWFVDDPRTILMGSRAYASDYAVAFTWEAAYADYLRDCGFSAAHVLPLGVDDTIFNAPPAEDCPLPPSFVGNSMEEFAAREWAWVRERPALCGAVEAALEAGRVTREHFAVGMEAVLGGTDGFSPDEVRHAEILCFVEGTRRLRHGLARATAPLGAVMHGDPGWAAVTEHCAGPVHYFDELPRHYQATPVNLNTTSVQMASAVNQRVFDCPASGGFLLTDAQASLQGLFDVEREVAVYSDLDECAELLQQYVAAPALRAEMTHRARARILGEHTYRHRLTKMADVLGAQFRG